MTHTFISLNREFHLPATIYWRKICSFNNIPLNQRCPTGVSRPLRIRSKIFGVRYAIFESESLQVLGCIFFNRVEIYQGLQVFLLKRTLFSLIIPANVTKLTIQIA